MNYYRLILKNHNDTMDPESPGPKMYPRANGSKISNALDCFWKDREPGRIHLGNYVDQTPVFDYFHLYSLTYKREYDWILLDAYFFVGQNVPSIRGFLVSERLKQVLEEFVIAQPYRFYPSKLMYQGQKLTYYIFHLAQDEWNEFLPESSAFYVDGGVSKVNILNNQDLKKWFRENKDHGRKVLMEISMSNYSDIFYFSQFDYLVSEKLKQRIEMMGFTDFEFSLMEHVSFSFKGKIE